MTYEEAITELEQVSQDAEQLADWQQDIVRAVMSGKYRVNVSWARRHGKRQLSDICERIERALDGLGV